MSWYPAEYEAWDVFCEGMAAENYSDDELEQLFQGHFWPNYNPHDLQSTWWWFWEAKGADSERRAKG